MPERMALLYLVRVCRSDGAMTATAPVAPGEDRGAELGVTSRVADDHLRRVDGGKSGLDRPLDVVENPVEADLVLF